MLREPTPSELVIIQAIHRRWKEDYVHGDSFNMIIQRAATDCGVSYKRAERIARRALDPITGDWLFPCGGWGVLRAP